MSVMDDSKKFAFKGNVVDLAVGVIIGGAFGKIVSALVVDVIMSLLLRSVGFALRYFSWAYVRLLPYSLSCCSGAPAAVFAFFDIGAPAAASAAGAACCQKAGSASLLSRLLRLPCFA